MVGPAGYPSGAFPFLAGVEGYGRWEERGQVERFRMTWTENGYVNATTDGRMGCTGGSSIDIPVAWNG